jgi:MGT family glycosyltransferase
MIAPALVVVDKGPHHPSHVANRSLAALAPDVHGHPGRHLRKQPLLRGEAPEHGLDGDARLLGNGVERDLVVGHLAEALIGGLEDALPGRLARFGTGRHKVRPTRSVLTRVRFHVSITITNMGDGQHNATRQPMMRVLFTTNPSAGAFHPLVPLARALSAAGHQVAFAAARSYCPVITANGFRCFPAGVDWLNSELEPVFDRARQLVAGRGGPFSPLRDVFGDYLPPTMITDLLALARSWPPDLVVRDPLEFAGCLVAEHLRLPHVACGPLFCFWEGAWHHKAGEVAMPELSRLRESLGLAPDPDLSMLHRYLYLAFLPPAFIGPELYVPPTVQFLRPISFNQSGSEGLPHWMATRPMPVTVHASLGTIFHRTPGVFAAIIEALRDEAINLIVAVGRDQDPAEFGAQPANVHIERYIPHALLLPSCDAIINHGGFSSIMACLNEGLPMVLVPLAGGDQHGNAQRCAELGVGRVIAARERVAEAIRDAVREVLDDPRYRQRAKRMRDEMQALPGPEHAVSLLEALAVEHIPRL